LSDCSLIRLPQVTCSGAHRGERAGERARSAGGCHPGDGRRRRAGGEGARHARSLQRLRCLLCDTMLGADRLQSLHSSQDGAPKNVQWVIQRCGTLTCTGSSSYASSSSSAAACRAASSKKHRSRGANLIPRQQHRGGWLRANRAKQASKAAQQAAPKGASGHMMYRWRLRRVTGGAAQQARSHCSLQLILATAFDSATRITR
jgi:hypothetical protein